MYYFLFFLPSIWIILFIPSLVYIKRKTTILKKLFNCGATSYDTAKTLSEAGVRNPEGFSGITLRMIKKGTLKKNDNGKYYI